MRMSVVTPCYNAGKYLAETIEAVLGQTALRSGRVELDYWIVDGASRDDSVAIAQRYARDGVKLLSEPDRGMYDALAKGLQRVDGDVCCYINAGDYHHKAAFDVVADVFEQQPSVQWLTGMYVIYNERSQVVLAQQPQRIVRSWVRRGVYDGRARAHIQQESTFWRRALLDEVDFERLRQWKLAGDFYLWHSFAKRHELFIVESYLGGFKLHAGQLSEQLDRYAAEVHAICGAPVGAVDGLLALGSRVFEKISSRRLREALGYDQVIRWDNTAQRWVMPPGRPAPPPG